jgi:nifR3 family TIM-barrel protein
LAHSPHAMDAVYQSVVNRDVPLARPDEFKPLALGSLRVWPPVVLAPMAGVTNPPFRSICRSFGAGLYVSEMVTARPLVEGNAKTDRLASFAPDEKIRSLQLYGVDPYYVGEAAKRLTGEGRIDHLDLNFGCPVRKVTRRGGGAAIPCKPKLLAKIVAAAVSGAGKIPVTIKFRIGINDEILTYLESGRIGQEEGCAWVALHARTAAQLYDGQARWDAIGRLKQHVERIPVLGNGDIWEAQDALRMLRQTGCDGVVVGRGCLGRPWLFRDLVDVFEGKSPSDPPNLGAICEIMQRHAQALCDWLGEPIAMRQFRRHATWYTKGFRGSARMRDTLMHVSTMAGLREALATLDPTEAFPPGSMRVPRGKTSGRQIVSLPDGYLDRLDDDTPPEAETEADGDGG